MAPQGNTRDGLRRLSTAVLFLGAAYFVVFVLGWETLVAFLRWLEYLSDTRGLSGFFFLALAPVLFIAACFGVDWIAAGFKGRGLGAELQLKDQK